MALLAEHGDKCFSIFFSTMSLFCTKDSHLSIGMWPSAKMQVGLEIVGWVLRARDGIVGSVRKGILCDGDCVIGGVPCDGIQGESGDRDHAMGVQGECGGLWDGEDLDPRDGGQGQGGFPCDGGVCVMCVQGEGGGQDLGPHDGGQGGGPCDGCSRLGWGLRDGAHDETGGPSDGGQHGGSCDGVHGEKDQQGGGESC